MKSHAVTVLLVESRRVARWDAATHACAVAARPAGTDFPGAVRLAASLGGKVATTWVVVDDLFTQRLTLGPAQVAGLTPDQLTRALSFEAEPFSGLPVTESATGYRGEGGGVFTVVQMRAADRAGAVQAVAAAGGGLAGIAPAGTPPEDEAALARWFAGLAPDLPTTAHVPPPGRSRTRRSAAAVGVGLAVAAGLVLGACFLWNGVRIFAAERQFAEVNEARRLLQAERARLTQLQAEEKALLEAAGRRTALAERRRALAAVLRQLSAAASEDTVVRQIQAEGTSRLVVSGVSMEAGAVDELSIVLSQRLQPHGWTATPRQKKGRRTLPSGGPWDFSLELRHREALAVRKPEAEDR